MPEILACLRVSRHWQRLAEDNIIWRGFYYRAGFSINSQAVRQVEQNPLVPPPTPITPSSPPLSALSKFVYYIPSYPSSLRTSMTSSAPHHSTESDLQLHREATASLGPLSLDWKILYKTRLDI